MKRFGPLSIVLVLCGAAFYAATALDGRVAAWRDARTSQGVINEVLGEARRLFADQFFEMADVYFHSGYYPSVFDRGLAPTDTRHMKSEEGHEHEAEAEKEQDFLGKPRDWVERFGRHFMITEHTHLEGGNEREILPWLRLSATLDPERVETYTVSAYWLRKRLNKVAEAEQFLREGLKANPNSYEILYELAQLYDENKHDPERSLNLLEAALRRWYQREAGSKTPDMLTLEEICVHLAHVEEELGNLEAAIGYLQTAKKAARVPEPLQRQIDELRAKLAARQPGSTPK